MEAAKKSTARRLPSGSRRREEFGADGRWADDGEDLATLLDNEDAPIFVDADKGEVIDPADQDDYVMDNGHDLPLATPRLRPRAVSP